MSPDRIAALLSPFLGDAPLTDAQLSQLAAYLDLLLRWNARMNLTGVGEPDAIVTRHFGESLFTARHLYPPGGKPENGNFKLIDIGSGAGFPGLPIKIWAPDLQVTLLESNQRKATFLREAARTLQLEVEVLTTRAEDYVRQISNYKLQIANLTVTLRAVERFNLILPTAVNLLRNLTTSDCRLALLISAAQIETARSLAAAVSFADPLPIPQSSQRVLLVGAMTTGH